MAFELNRRSLLKLGTFAGITVMLGKPMQALATEVDSSAPTPPWIGQDGKARFRWDAVRKVTGQKNFARDFRARDLAGWPEAQSHAFMIKATRADRSFERIDLSMLDADLQPDRIVLHEDLAAVGIDIPQDSGMGKGFYGTNILVPKGETPPLLGHPVAILIYRDYPRFSAARRRLQFEDAAVIYGPETGPRPPANYGAGRFVRIEGEGPLDPPVFSPYQDAAIKGHFDGNTPIWPPFPPENQPGPVTGRERGGGFITALKDAEAKPDTQGMGMEAIARIDAEIAAAKDDPARFVLQRQVFSQSIDPSAMEPDNCNAWYDAASRTLHILTATQSPAGVIDAVTAMMKGNTAYPVETLVLLTGSTVGYGSKDYSVFPFYAVAAAFLAEGAPLRMANNRYDQFQMGMKRHSIAMDVTITGDRETGRFEILQGSYTCNGGGRENLSVAVSHVGARGAQSIYYFPKSDLTALAMATPAVEAGSMRGFGSLQSMAATEMMVDEIADQLKIDPIELRRRNAMQPGDANTQGGVAAGDLRLPEMLDRAARHPIWKDRDSAKTAYEAAHPGHLYGVGFAQVQQVYGSSGVPTALQLEFDPDGRLIMRHCIQEIGTGATTAQQVMVWQGLGKAPDEVEFGMTEFPQLPLHTGWADQAEQDRLSTSDPYWTPSLIPDMSSSTSVYYLGFGTRQAARFLLEFSLWPAARAIWSRGQTGGAIASYNIDFADIRVGPEGIGGAGMRPLSFAELAREAQDVALGVHRALGCEGYTRTDVILGPQGPVMLEINTLPGLTGASFIPQQLAAAGIDVREFVLGQLELARARRDRSVKPG